MSAVTGTRKGEWLQSWDPEDEASWDLSLIHI